MTEYESFEPALQDVELSRRRFLQLAGLAGGSLALAACSNAENPADSDEATSSAADAAIEKVEVKGKADLVRNGNWRHAAGIQTSGDELRLSPTGLSIVNKRENNRIEPNPPLNLYGTRLQVEGDFRLAATIESRTPVSLQLFSKPPVRFDDFNYYQPGMQCTLGQDTMTVRSWDGQSQQPSEQQFQFPASGDRHNLEMRRIDNDLVIMANGRTSGRLALGGLFSNGEVWLGLNSEEGPARVRSLSAYPGRPDRLWLADTASLHVTERMAHGLQSLVPKPDFQIGAAAALGPMVADERYAGLMLGGEIGSITTENALKPQDTQPTEGVFTLGEADALVELAQRHGLTLHGHTLVYDKAMPLWMRQLPTDSEADKQRVRQVLETHISTIAGHFKGRIASWDVVNEPIAGFSDEAGLQQSLWFRALGEEYIDIALKAARQADPDAKLYVNDFGMETNYEGRGTFMVELAKRLLARGAPLDGIGIEGHVYQLPRDGIDSMRLGKLMDDFDKLGLKVRVSELDVTGDISPEVQAGQYKSVLAACLFAPNCTGLTIWGLTDAYGSTASLQAGRLEPGNALPYTADYQPKPARQAMLEALQP